MGRDNFNRRQCIRALKKLDFKCLTKRKGKHDKYKAPEQYRSVIPFIMVPRHKKLHCQDAIIRELRKMGSEELVEKFRKYL